MCNDLRMSNTSTPDLIGSKEACRLLGDISRATLTRWVTAGRLHAAAKLPGTNGAYMFDREHIESIADELGERPS